MIKVEKIYYKDKQSSEIISDKVKLISGYGIDGDIHGGRPGRNVSIMFETSRLKVSSTPIKGLCTSRFKENITLSGIAHLKIGDIISIENCKIKITQIGKKCFNECELFKNKMPCYLNEVIFGEVMVSGELEIGDEVLIHQEFFV